MADVIPPLVSTFDQYDTNVRAAFLEMASEAQSASDSVTARIGELQTLVDQTLMNQANNSYALAILTVFLSVRVGLA